MITFNDIHQQFAEYFAIPPLKPYAYLLSKKLSEGHICLDLDKPLSRPDEMPAFCQNIPLGAAPLKSLPLIARDGKDNQPFVLYKNRLYIQRYFRYESGLLQRIGEFLQTEQEVLPQRVKLLKTQEAVIKNLLKTDDPAKALPAQADDITDWQLAAIITGILNNFTIITGGPGTGKTTTVARILAVLYTLDPALRVALAAPTGKAAARMAESLRNTTIPLRPEILEKFKGLKPSTIHRLLRSKPGALYFRHDRDNPLPFDVVIIDECSMIDMALFAKLLAAIGASTRLILLGDKDQLASVEAGSLFGDICQAQEQLNLFTAKRVGLINSFIANSQRQVSAAQVNAGVAHPLFEHIVELRYSHRFSGKEGIGLFSKAVISGNVEGLQAPNERVTIDPTWSVDLFEKFVAGYAAVIREKDIRTALRNMNALRVLCAVRESEHGLYAVNKEIERYLHSRRLIVLNGEFYENRPVILTRNYYEFGLFNGDIGIVRPDVKGSLRLWFEDSDGELKSILPSYINQAETVFAMTIHKSQGSEFDEVLVVLPSSPDSPILTRELLYTAVTRAKKKVYIQGPMEVIVAASQRHVERASGIASRFQELPSIDPNLKRI